jgi:muconolactone delta-isomerase
MEFLVEFDVDVPDAVSESERTRREGSEASAAARLAREGHLLRVWTHSSPNDRSRVLGLYRTETRSDLEGLLRELPLHEWMSITVDPLQPHPNDPAPQRSLSDKAPSGTGQLPAPKLSLVFRLAATLGEALDLRETVRGRRRIVPLNGGTFAGPELSGNLLPGASADWQTLLPDGTAIADLRYTLRTDGGDLLYARSRGVRHGEPDVLARVARGETAMLVSTSFAPPPGSKRQSRSSIG